MSEDLIALGKERGWPEGLVERALAVKTPRFLLNMWLDLNSSETHQIERIIEVYEATTGGSLRARDLTHKDLESFADVWATSSEKIGDWEVTVERGPDAVAQYRLHGDVCITAAEEHGQIVACAMWSNQNCLIGGKRTAVSYAHGLRVHGDHRRKGLGDIVRRFPARALQKPALGQVMFMRLGNEGVAGFFKAVGFQENRDRPQHVAEVTQLTPATAPAEPAGVRPATEDDLPICATLINRTHGHLDLFTPFTAESLFLALNENSWGPHPPWRPLTYGLADLFVAESDGAVVACGGLWDRGRDVRERWRGPAGEARLVESAALLDFGCAEGQEAALAGLIRFLTQRTGELGRQTLLAPLQQAPAIAGLLGDLGPTVEARIMEWTPYQPTAPRKLGDCFIDLRYW